MYAGGAISVREHATLWEEIEAIVISQCLQGVVISFQVALSETLQSVNIAEMDCTSLFLSSVRIVKCCYVVSISAVIC